MRHPLSEQYRDGRQRLLELGRTLTDSEGDIVTSACPAWTVKDVFAHLAGISSDILSGNTEGAATEAWADRQVAERADHTLQQVLDEWTTAGAEVSTAVESAGEAFPFQLFLDQWTHEWDVRAALGPQAAAAPDPTVFRHYFDELAGIMAEDEKGRGLDRLTVEVDGHRFTIGDDQPPHRDLGDVSLTMFEFARICMGRRSRRQLTELDWPMEDFDPHLDVLVLWSVADRDVIDPVIQAD